MKAEANQNGRAGFLTNKKELLWTFGLSLALVLVFEFFFAYNSNAPHWGLDGRLPIIAFATFSLWFIVIWLIDFEASGSFFRNYRWIASPAIVLIIFLLGVSWAQSKLIEETIEQYIVLSFEVDSTSNAYIRYPKNIPIGNTSNFEISIWSNKDWLGCALPVTLVISSTDNALLFASQPESEKLINWKNTIQVILRKDAREAVLLVQPAQTPSEESLSSNLKVNGIVQEEKEPISIESARVAQIRKWKSLFLENGSIVFPLISAALAWFKQKEDEKKKEQKETIKQFIENFEEKAQKDLTGTLDLLERLLSTDEWEAQLLDELREKFTSFFEKHLWQAPSTLYVEPMEKGGDRFLSLWETIFDEKIPTPKELDALKKLKLATKFEDLEQILLSFPQSAAVLNILAKSRFSKPITLKSERIRREEQIRFWAKTSSENPKLKAWLHIHGLTTSPFLDAETPYTLMPDKRQMLIEPYSSFDFSKDEILYQGSSLIFKNQWDADAGIFEYLKQSRLIPHQQPFIVLMSSNIVQIEHEPQDFILRALAESWLFEIVEDETVFYALSESQRGLIGKLLLWHQGSANSAIAKIEMALEYKLYKFRDKKEDFHILAKKISTWLNAFNLDILKGGEVQTLLRIRPPATNFTLVLNSIDHLKSVSNEIAQTPDWKFVNIQISVQNPILVGEKNLVTICRERIKICSQGQVNALEELCIPHDGPPADEILAQKAKSSPGEMVRLGQALLLRHVEIHSPDDDIEIDELKNLA